MTALCAGSQRWPPACDCHRDLTGSHLEHGRGGAHERVRCERDRIGHDRLPVDPAEVALRPQISENKRIARREEPASRTQLFKRFAAERRDAKEDDECRRHRQEEGGAVCEARGERALAEGEGEGGEDLERGVRE